MGTGAKSLFKAFLSDAAGAKAQGEAPGLEDVVQDQDLFEREPEDPNHMKKKLAQNIRAAEEPSISSTEREIMP